MKTKTVLFIFILGLIVGIVAFSYDQEISVFEKSPVLYLELSIKGDSDKPTIDINNISSSVELVPLIKQRRMAYELNPNSIHCEVYYNTSRIAYSTFIPYHGSDDYLVPIEFKDGAKLPTSDQEFVVVTIEIIDDGNVVLLNKLKSRWVNTTIV